MANITTGLTKNSSGNEGVTAHYAFSYDSTLQLTPSNPSGLEPARTNALIAVCEADYNLMAGWFGNIALTPLIKLPIPVTVANLGGGANTGGTFPNIAITLKPGNAAVELLRYLMVSEVTELFMISQHQGWADPDDSNEGSAGEGLSRFLAQQFLVLEGLGTNQPGFAISPSWLNSSLPTSNPASTQVVNGLNYGARADYVNNIRETDHGIDPATGCAMLFLYFLNVQLGFSINQIIAAASLPNATSILASVFKKLTGKNEDPFPIFANLLNANYPVDSVSTIAGSNPDNPFPLHSWLPSGASAAHGQLGLTQTDVFAIDRKGQLFVSWVDGGGSWLGPQPIGGAGQFPASAPLAAGPQFGLTQTDVFAVNTSGTLTVMWVGGTGNWNGPLAIGSAVFLPGAPVATSQQFGLNQTSVFAVNKSGALTVAWVSGGGDWNGPATISSANMFAPSTTVAACRQFGLTQTDVFAVDKTGAMTVSWVDGGGVWNGPHTISPAGTFIAGSPLAAGQQIGLTQTDIFAIDLAGALTVIWVDESGVWQGPVRISPVGTFLQGAAVATSEQFGLTQTDVFAVDKTGTLTVTWVDGGRKWNGPTQVGPVGLALPSATVSVCQQTGLSQTDVFLVDRNGDLNVFFASGELVWKGPIHL